MSHTGRCYHSIGYHYNLFDSQHNIRSHYIRLRRSPLTLDPRSVCCLGSEPDRYLPHQYRTNLQFGERSITSFGVFPSQKMDQPSLIGNLS